MQDLTLTTPAYPRFRMIRSVIALMLREMSTTYGRTPGGYVWAVLQPVGAVAMLTFVMVVGLKLRTPALGTNFPIYYATGILPFQLFTSVSGRVSGAVGFSRALLAYPRVSFVDAILARFLLHSLTKLVVSIIVLGTLMSVYDAQTRLDFVPILMAFGLSMLLALGFGCLTGYLFPVFPVLGSLWNIISTPMMLVSGVLFLYDDQSRWGRDILWYNPLVHIVGLARRGFYPMYTASYVSIPYVAGLSMIMLALGLLLLKRFHTDILER